MAEYDFEWEITPARKPDDLHLTIQGRSVDVTRTLVVVHVKQTNELELTLKKEAEGIANGVARVLSFKDDKRYTLRFAAQTCFLESGRRVIDVAARTVDLQFYGSAVVSCIDAEGIQSSIPAKIKNNAFEALFNKAESDEPLRRMLSHLANFYADPDRRLAHLFDVIEVAKSTYPPRDLKNLAKQLKIPFAVLDKAKCIIHDCTIATSRHPGQFPNDIGLQRAPTEEEMNQCLKAVKMIIDARIAQIPCQPNTEVDPC